MPSEIACSKNSFNRSFFGRVISISFSSFSKGLSAATVCDRLRQFATIQDTSHIQFENISIGEGAILCANTVLTGDIKIGCHFHCNIYSYVAHDCRIGDFVTCAPRVCCNGRIVIDDNAYIGTGAVLKQGSHSKPLRIGKGAIIGMGAIVLNDVEDGEVVVGNPARVIRGSL